MNIETAPTVDLQNLEHKIDALILLCQQLSDENQQLKATKTQLVQQQQALSEKNESAKTRIESMISRLKLMEI